MMKIANLLLAIAVTASLSLKAQTDTATGQYPESHPPAGIQPRRSPGYKPYKYPLSAQQLLKKYGPQTEKLSTAAWAEIDKVNAAGTYKNTYQSLASHPCPEWFKDAKIGMFIDWGPWSVGGYSTKAKAASYPDWYEHNAFDTANHEMSEYHRKTWGPDITDDDLINLLSDRNFAPERFARLAKECGFRYVVPFLKHHGGFCLWESSFTRRNSMEWAFHRDFAAELSKACKQEGLKFGDYVSVGEWDYPVVDAVGHIGSVGLDGKPRKIASLDECHYLSGKIPVTDYAKGYLIPSLKELLDKTKPDLIWYDGAWENTSTFFHTRDLNAYYYNKALLDNQEVCINDRSGSDYRDGKAIVGQSDFTTSEFGAGASTLEQTWEECRSFSHNFGYNWTEESDTSAILNDKECIDLVADIVGRGGNLLLIVSPTGTGEIPPRQLHALRNIGDWLGKFGEAIYNTRAYHLSAQPAWGRITHSKDNSTTYLLVTHWPADGHIHIPNIPVKTIQSAGVLNGQGVPGFTQPTDGGFMVDLSACTPGDPRVSVIAIKTRS